MKYFLLIIGSGCLVVHYHFFMRGPKDLSVILMIGISCEKRFEESF